MSESGSEPLNHMPDHRPLMHLFRPTALFAVLLAGESLALIVGIGPGHAGATAGDLRARVPWNPMGRAGNSGHAVPAATSLAGCLSPAVAWICLGMLLAMTLLSPRRRGGCWIRPWTRSREGAVRGSACWRSLWSSACWRSWPSRTTGGHATGGARQATRTGGPAGAHPPAFPVQHAQYRRGAGACRARTRPSGCCWTWPICSAPLCAGRN